MELPRGSERLNSNTDALLQCLPTHNTTPIHKYLCNAPAMPAMVNVQFVIALHVLGILSMGDGFNLHLKHAAPDKLQDTAPDKLHIETKTQDIVSSGDQTLPGSVTTASKYIQTIVDDWNGYQPNIPQTSSQFTNTFAGDLQIKRIAHIFAVDGVVTALQICLREVCKLYTAGAGNAHVHITRFKQHASVPRKSQFKWLRVPAGMHSRYCPSPTESWPLYSSDTPNSIPALCGRYYGEISRYTMDGVQIVVSSESAQPWSDTVDHATQLLYPYRTLRIDVFFDGVKCEEWRPPGRSPFSSQSAAISVFVVPGNMSHVIVPSLSMLRLMLCGFTPMPGVDKDVASHAVSLLPTMLLHFAEEQAQTPIAVPEPHGQDNNRICDLGTPSYVNGRNDSLSPTSVMMPAYSNSFPETSKSHTSKARNISPGKFMLNPCFPFRPGGPGLTLLLGACETWSGEGNKPCPISKQFMTKGVEDKALWLRAYFATSVEDGGYGATLTESTTVADTFSCTLSVQAYRLNGQQTKHTFKLTLAIGPSTTGGISILHCRTPNFRMSKSKSDVEDCVEASIPLLVPCSAVPMGPESHNRSNRINSNSLLRGAMFQEWAEYRCDLSNLPLPEAEAVAEYMNKPPPQPKARRGRKRKDIFQAMSPEDFEEVIQALRGTKIETEKPTPVTAEPSVLEEAYDELANLLLNP